MVNASHVFPKNFKWGTATAAHQVEGGNTNNNWWHWEQSSGRIQNGDRSERACDWWDNAEADFDRMVDLGLNAHRLSIEWSRVEPREGHWDSAALERYRAMLLGLRQRGIEPMVTLHHFTHPMWIEEQGGWQNLAVIVPRFRRFVDQVVKVCGDVCDLWCTINEPTVYAITGYLDGRHPPGKRGDLQATLYAVRSMLFAHAAAYEVIHERQRTARVGLAHHMRLFQGLRAGHPMDTLIAAVYNSAVNDSVITALTEGRWNRVVGRYLDNHGVRNLKGTLDWIGLNYYTRERVKFNRDNPEALYGELAPTPGAPQSDFGYGEIYPEGMMHFMRKLSRLGLPIYITENGLPDAVDALRPGFILAHLKQLWLAVNFNYDVLGYYHWSLTDNFEWSEGWRMRFGLYALDQHTQRRTLRPSGRLYRDIAQGGAISSELCAQYAPELMHALFPG